MIDPAQIPDEVVEAAARAIGAETYVGNKQTLRDAGRAAIAAAINAWPGEPDRALVKKVATLINSMTHFWSMDLSLRQAEKTATAAIDLIRAETLEEAAVVFSRYEDYPFTAAVVADHLRRMKGTT